MAATPDGMKRFYAILAGVAVVGLGLLGYLMSRPKTLSVPANVTVSGSPLMKLAVTVVSVP